MSAHLRKCLLSQGAGVHVWCNMEGLEGQVQARTGKACPAKEPVLTLRVTGSRRRRWRVRVTSSSSDQGRRKLSPGSEEARSVHSSPTRPLVPATSHWLPDTEPGKRTHGAGHCGHHGPSLLSSGTDRHGAVLEGPWPPRLPHLCSPPPPSSPPPRADPHLPYSW